MEAGVDTDVAITLAVGPHSPKLIRLPVKSAISIYEGTPASTSLRHVLRDEHGRACRRETIGQDLEAADGGGGDTGVAASSASV